MASQSPGTVVVPGPSWRQPKSTVIAATPSAASAAEDLTGVEYVSALPRVATRRRAILRGRQTVSALRPSSAPSKGRIDASAFPVPGLVRGGVGRLRRDAGAGPAGLHVGRDQVVRRQLRAEELCARA